MANFLFAVGFSLAIVWNRARLGDSASRRATWLRLGRRCFLLLVVAVLVYFPFDTPKLAHAMTTGEFWFAFFKRDWVQTLTHIAFSTLWTLCVLPASWRVRWCWLVGGIVLHLVASHMFYFHWVHASPGGIDGGPLGFLTWSISTFFGLWVGEQYVHASNDTNTSLHRSSLRRTCIGIGCVLMFSGYIASCGTRRFDRDAKATEPSMKLASAPVVGKENSRDWLAGYKWRNLLAEPPFVPPPPWQERAWNYWMMSQKAGTLSYQIFAAGFSLLLFIAFDSVCARGYQGLGIFQSMGRNAILCYVLHGYVIAIAKQWVPKDATPLTVGLACMGVVFAVYMVAMGLERRGWLIRL